MFFKSKFLIFIFYGESLSTPRRYCEPAAQENQEALPIEDLQEEDIDLDTVSEAFGHTMGKHVTSIDVTLNYEQFIKGLKDSIAGKDSPMDQNACIQAISTLQEEAYQPVQRKPRSSQCIYGR